MAATRYPSSPSDDATFSPSSRRFSSSSFDDEGESENTPMLGNARHHVHSKRRGEEPEPGTIRPDPTQTAQLCTAVALFIWVLAFGKRLPDSLRIMILSEGLGQSFLAASAWRQHRTHGRGERTIASSKWSIESDSKLEGGSFRHEGEETGQDTVQFTSLIQSDDIIVASLGLCAYISFVVGVSFGRFCIGAAGFGSPVFGRGSTPGARYLAFLVFLPLLMSACTLRLNSRWPMRSYCSLVFLASPIFASSGMFWRFLQGQGDAEGLHALLGSIALVGYLFPAFIHASLQPAMKRWHMELINGATWLLLGFCGEGMLRGE